MSESDSDVEATDGESKVAKKIRKTNPRRNNFNAFTSPFRDVEDRYLEIEKESTYSKEESTRFKLVCSNCDWMVEIDKGSSRAGRYIDGISLMVAVVLVLVIPLFLLNDAKAILAGYVDGSGTGAAITYLINYAVNNLPSFMIPLLIVSTIVKFANNLVMRVRFDRLYHRLVVYFMDSKTTVEEIKEIRNGFREVKDLDEIFSMIGVDRHDIRNGLNPRISTASIIGIAGIILFSLFNSLYCRYYYHWYSDGLMLLGLLSIISACVMIAVPCIMNFLQKDFIYSKRYAKCSIWFVVLYFLFDIYLVTSFLDEPEDMLYLLVGPATMIASSVLFIIRGPDGKRF